MGSAVSTVGDAVHDINEAFFTPVKFVGDGIGSLLSGPGDPPPPIPPPPTPDLADELSKRADLVKQMRLMASGTGDFVSGPYGDTSKPPGSPPVARGQ